MAILRTHSALGLHLASFHFGPPRRTASITQPLRPHFLQDGGGDLFNRLGGGRQPADAGAAHHGLGFAHFHAAVLQTGIARIGPALGADFRQALGADGQAEDLLLEGHQRRWQLAAVKVFRNQRVVGRLEPMLHRQVQRGGRLAAAADPHQNHVGRVQVLVALAIVVRQAVVDGLDAVVVFLAFADVREAPDTVVRLHAQLVFQRVHKGAEHVQQHALATFLDHLEHVHVHQRSEDDGLVALQFGGVVDLAHHLVRLVHGVGERQAHTARRQLELRQDGVAKGLCSDAGAVGDKENGALVHVLGA